MSAASDYAPIEQQALSRSISARFRNQRAWQTSQVMGSKAIGRTQAKLCSAATQYMSEFEQLIECIKSVFDNQNFRHAK